MIGVDPFYKAAGKLRKGPLHWSEVNSWVPLLSTCMRKITPFLSVQLEIKYSCCRFWYCLKILSFQLFFPPFVEFIWMTLVNKTVQVSGVQFHNTSSVPSIVCSAPQLKLPSPFTRPPPTFLSPLTPADYKLFIGTLQELKGRSIESYCWLIPLLLLPLTMGTLSGTPS